LYSSDFVTEIVTVNASTDNHYRSSVIQRCHYTKKFELMLTRRAKAYSSSCSQTVSLSLAISSQFILRVCVAAENCKSQ